MNKPITEIGRTVEIKKISEAAWELVVYAPKIASICKAGQFVHIRCADQFQPFLRRPFSIGPTPHFPRIQSEEVKNRASFLSLVQGSQEMSISAQMPNEEEKKGCIRLIFTVRGVGTHLLTKKQVDDPVDIIGPLGNPFIFPDEDVMPILVAGGIGIVPLLRLDDELPDDQERRFLLGIRSKDMLTINESEVERREIIVACDNGDLGFQGNVVELLAHQLDDELSGRSVIVYGCGPTMMVVALKELCLGRDIPGYISMEVPMGCGIGACQSCIVPRADGEGYRLVCSDGPVFDMREIDLKPETML
ncbi:MAG: dihydroorotate dehydrogenase electron transfer subunit [Candidatus Electryoneaceae bacterium]|nr:dihydroorotate dehydrogenase electron transfer subunit [Candidatus Electryoneaceae bacterium]